VGADSTGDVVANPPSDIQAVLPAVRDEHFAHRRPRAVGGAGRAGARLVESSRVERMLTQPFDSVNESGLHTGAQFGRARLPGPLSLCSAGTSPSQIR